MNCGKVRKKILLGEVMNPKLRAHLEKCAECAILADSLDKFIPSKPDETYMEVPHNIDNFIKSEARDAIDGRTPPHALTADNPYRDFASYFAIAATFILISWLFVSLLIPKNELEKSSFSNSVEKPSSTGTASTVSLLWNDKVVEDDFFTIDTNIEFTLALMSFTSDDELENSSGDDFEVDDRFNVEIPDILT